MSSVTRLVHFGLTTSWSLLSSIVLLLELIDLAIWQLAYSVSCDVMITF